VGIGIQEIEIPLIKRNTAHASANPNKIAQNLAKN